MNRNVIICLVLAGVTLGLYGPVGHYGLILYDDPLFLTECPEIQGGLNWHSFIWAFSSVMIANWHPVTTLSFVIDHQLWGTNPGAEHVVNVLFHAANAVLLYLLLQTMTGSPWRSALVAAVFAWHPLRVESVVWITERKDVLCGFFFLLTLLFYVRYAQGREARSKKRGPEVGSRKSEVREAGPIYWLAWFCFALGLMSKAMLVTVPFVLLLLDVWPLKRWGFSGDGTSATAKRLLWEKWPFFGLAALFGGLTYSIQKNYAAVVSLDHLGWNFRIANAITDYGRYLAKLFWPVDLAVMYPYQRIDDWLQTGLIALPLAGISGVCLWQLRRRPWLAVGWFWYLGTSVPIIGLVQVGEASMADRYTYLTLLGPVMALVWLIPEIWWEDRVRKVLLGLGSTIVLGALMVLTRLQIQYWHDSVSLFAHAIAVTGNNPGAETGLGIGLEHEGRLAEHLAHYRRAVVLNPNDRESYLKVGHIYMAQNQWAAAEEAMFAVLALEPRDLAAHENLGAILPHLGRKVEARQQWEEALKTAPDATDVLNNLAWMLATDSDATVRDGRQAVRIAEHACELTHYKETVFMGTLAAAYAEAGRFDDAMATAQKACANASARGETELLKRNQELLALYEKHQAWHEPAEKLVPAAP